MDSKHCENADTAQNEIHDTTVTKQQCERRSTSAEIHTRNNNEAAARAVQHQRGGISLTAPWRFLRDPTNVLLRLFLLPLRSLRSRDNQSVYASTLQFMNRATTTLLSRSLRIIGVSSVFSLRSWLLFCAHHAAQDLGRRKIASS